MATLNISLPDTLQEFVNTEAAQGGFPDAGEYVRALVQDAQARRAQENLEAALLQGLDSGPSTPMTGQDWTRIRQQVGERAAQRS